MGAAGGGGGYALGAVCWAGERGWKEEALEGREWMLFPTKLDFFDTSADMETQAFLS